MAPAIAPPGEMGAALHPSAALAKGAPLFAQGGGFWKEKRLENIKIMGR